MNLQVLQILRLETIEFWYSLNWQFDNAYLVIEFKFKNAIWCQIGNVRKFDLSKPIILNLTNIHENVLCFKVFGLFQHKVFDIKLNKEAHLNIQPFNIKVENVGLFDLKHQKLHISVPEIAMRTNHITFTIERIALKSQNVQLNYNHFKIKDYI